MASVLEALLDVFTFDPAIEHAIELDPRNAHAHVLLASLYKSLGRSRDHARSVDLMAARFPDEKVALVAAGVGALDTRSPR